MSENHHLDMSRCSICGRKTMRKFRQQKRNVVCDTCVSIRERQATAKETRNNRAYKKNMSKFGKWLLDEKTAGNSWFTARRYVSKEEVDEMMRRVLVFTGCLVCHERVRHIPILDGVKYRGCYITKPGFYRVGAMPEIKSDNDISWASTAYDSDCAGIINEHPASLERRAYDTYLHNKIRTARFAAIDKKWSERCKNRRKQQAVKSISTAPDSDTVKFFRTISMASAVRCA